MEPFPARERKAQRPYSQVQYDVLQLQADEGR